MDRKDGPQTSKMRQKIRRPLGFDVSRPPQGKGLPFPLTPFPWTSVRRNHQKHMKTRHFNRNLRFVPNYIYIYIYRPIVSCFKKITFLGDPGRVAERFIAISHVSFVSNFTAKIGAMLGKKSTAFFGLRRFQKNARAAISRTSSQQWPKSPVLFVSSFFYNRNTCFFALSKTVHETTDLGTNST